MLIDFLFWVKFDFAGEILVGTHQGERQSQQSWQQRNLGAPKDEGLRQLGRPLLESLLEIPDQTVLEEEQPS